MAGTRGADEARHGGAGAVTSKYHAVKVNDPEYGSFDSRREYQHFLCLRLLEAAGEIEGLQRQTPFHLWVNDQHICKYVADFTFMRNGVLVVQDVKSPPTKTPLYRLKKKLMRACHGVEIEEIQ